MDATVSKEGVTAHMHTSVPRATQVCRCGRLRHLFNLHADVLSNICLIFRSGRIITKYSPLQRDMINICAPARSGAGVDVSTCPPARPGAGGQVPITHGGR